MRLCLRPAKHLQRVNPKFGWLPQLSNCGNIACRVPSAIHAVHNAREPNSTGLTKTLMCGAAPGCAFPAIEPEPEQPGFVHHVYECTKCRSTQSLRTPRSMSGSQGQQNGDRMAKFAIVATVKTTPGKRDEYLKHLKAHAQRCLATSTRYPGVRDTRAKGGSRHPHAVRVDASPEAFQAHWTGPSMQQAKQDAAGLQVSLSGVRCDIVE